MTWIDVGGATIEAEAVQYVEDTRPQHGSGFAKGMKSVVTLKNGGGWFYARMGRSAILRRVKVATAPASDARVRELEAAITAYIAEMEDQGEHIDVLRRLQAYSRLKAAFDNTRRQTDETRTRNTDDSLRV